MVLLNRGISYSDQKYTSIKHIDLRHDDVDEVYESDNDYIDDDEELALVEQYIETQMILL